MPLYDLQCDACGKGVVDVLMTWNDTKPCPECGSPMCKVPGCPVPHIFPKDGIFLKHVSSEGKRFHSKREMKNYAKKHDLELGAL